MMTCNNMDPMETYHFVLIVSWAPITTTMGRVCQKVVNALPNPRVNVSVSAAIR